MINIIRKEVLSGITKYYDAKELGISDKVVYHHVRDIPSKNPDRSEIRGNTLEILKQLLTDGYVNSIRGKEHRLHLIQYQFLIPS
jgi:hypothetical protein